MGVIIQLLSTVDISVYKDIDLCLSSKGRNKNAKIIGTWKIIPEQFSIIEMSTKKIKREKFAILPWTSLEAIHMNKCTKIYYLEFSWFLKVLLFRFIRARVDQLFILGVAIPPWIGNPYNGYINGVWTLAHMEKNSHDFWTTSWITHRGAPPRGRPLWRSLVCAFRGIGKGDSWGLVSWNTSNQRYEIRGSSYLVP